MWYFHVNITATRAMLVTISPLAIRHHARIYIWMKFDPSQKLGRTSIVSYLASRVDRKRHHRNKILLLLVLQDMFHLDISQRPEDLHLSLSPFPVDSTAFEEHVSADVALSGSVYTHTVKRKQLCMKALRNSTCRVLAWVSLSSARRTRENGRESEWPSTLT